jgi:hypothetical protein
VTLFDLVSRQSKKLPGPTTYKAMESYDKCKAPKIKGCLKTSNAKFSIIESESFWKKKDPGPQHKYTLNYDMILPRRPRIVSMSKTTGRF